MADFDYANPLTDVIAFPTEPVSEAAGRAQFMVLFDEIKARLNEGEEGNWTPAINGTIVSGVNTYSERVGRYYKTGKLVFISGKITLSAKGGTMDGNVRIAGLPFTAETSAAMAGINIATATSFDLSAGYSQLCGRVTTGTTYIDIYQIGDNVAVNTIPVAQIANTSSITFSAVYKTT